MQQAKGTVILSPENHLVKEGVTPAESMVLHKLHFAYANGSPLGDFFINKEEAVTVDVPARSAVEPSLNHLNQLIPGKEAVPAKTHKRTQAEEIARLRRKYTGNITVDGVAKPAFEATFGSGIGVRIPETFEEIVPFVGERFFEQGDTDVFSDDRERTVALAKRTRPELVEIARALSVDVHPADSKEFVIAAIVNAENRQQAEAATKTVEETAGGLESKNKGELQAIAAELGLETAGTKAELIAAINAKQNPGA